MFEVIGEGSEAATEELLSGGSGPAVFLFPSAGDVDGDDLLGFLAGGIQGGIVGEAEVPAEPVKDCFEAFGHIVWGTFRWTGGEKRQR